MLGLRRPWLIGPNTAFAGDLSFSELTIAGLLGHAAHGITQRYVHLDTTLVVAADRVSMEIATMLDGRVSGEPMEIEPAAEKEQNG